MKVAHRWVPRMGATYTLPHLLISHLGSGERAIERNGNVTVPGTALQT